MAVFFSSLSLLLSLAALIKTTLDRRAPGSFPLLLLLRERFAQAAPYAILLAILVGSLSVLLPFLLFSILGWARVERVENPLFPFFFLAGLTLLVKIFWAGLEELIYRGAVLPQIAKRAPAWLGLLVSALLFAFGHLEGRAENPGLFSLVVYVLDGIGFGIAFLATRSLWPAVLWHASKNLWIWLLFSESTIQFAPGLFRTTYSGPSLWTGTSQQAGLADVLVTAALVLAALWLARGLMKPDLQWVKTQ